MALSTEFVAKADEYQSIIQTVNTSSTVIYIPDGVWMCSLTATVPIPGQYFTASWIRLNGQTATVNSVEETAAHTTPRADLGVVVPSFVGGRTISVESKDSRTMNFYAAKIGH